MAKMEPSEKEVKVELQELISSDEWILLGNLLAKRVGGSWASARQVLEQWVARLKAAQGEGFCYLAVCDPSSYPGRCCFRVLIGGIAQAGETLRTRLEQEWQDLGGTSCYVIDHHPNDPALSSIFKAISNGYPIFYELSPELSRELEGLRQRVKTRLREEKQRREGVEYHIFGASGRTQEEPGAFAWYQPDTKQECVKPAQGATPEQARYHALLSVLEQAPPNSKVLILTECKTLCRQLDFSRECHPLEEFAGAVFGSLQKKNIELRLAWIPREKNQAAKLLARSRRRKPRAKSIFGM